MKEKKDNVFIENSPQEISLDDKNKMDTINEIMLLIEKIYPKITGVTGHFDFNKSDFFILKFTINRFIKSGVPHESTAILKELKDEFKGVTTFEKNPLNYMGWSVCKLTMENTFELKKKWLKQVEEERISIQYQT